MSSSIRFALALACVATTGCDEPVLLDRPVDPLPTGEASGPVSDVSTLDLDLDVRVVADGLETPWALAFAPDGRIFVTERPGRIRVIEHGRLRHEPWGVINVAELSEAGLLGIALAPDFEQSGHVYVVGTFLPPRTLTAPRRRMVGRIVRLTDVGGFASEPVVVVDGLWTSQLHAGGALAFGPDGMLYLGTGDAADPAAAQDLDSPRGKVLRFRPDGTIPADNPIPDSPVYASGLRNVQGLAWHPITGDLLAIDHGPTGMAVEDGRTGDDELNAIRPGANYGWPVVTGTASDPGYDDPLVTWTTAIAPGGLAIYDGPVAAWRGHALITGLRGQQLRRVALEVDGDGERRLSAVGQEVYLHARLGRLRAVAVAPDGEIYLATSNRDGRGRAAAGDDRILVVRAPEVKP